MTQTTQPVAAPSGSSAHTVQVVCRARNVVRSFGSGSTTVTALQGVNLDLKAGEFTGIMGPSGSGKSTLMHCLAGLDSVSDGQILVGDHDLATMKDRALTSFRRDNMGFIFQAFNLIPTLSAEENILLPLTIAGRKPDLGWFNTIVDALGLRERLRHKPTELSGGQQQRVACARTLVAKPQIIFADEPTGNLDSVAGVEVLGILRDCVHKFGQTVVMVTHDPHAASYTDRIVFISDGQVAGELHHPTAEMVLNRMTALITGGAAC